MIAATSAHVVAIDNISTLRPWLSDALCRLATGGGFAVRELYSDDSEIIFDAMRPTILTGIEEPATRSDLVDRVLSLPLQRISETERKQEAAFWADFEVARPRILGALLGALSVALRERDRVALNGRPRMADFATTAAAAAKAIGWEAQDFLDSYSLNRKLTRTTAVESSQVGVATVKLMEKVSPWTGTSGELLACLAELVGEKVTRSRDWPKSPRGLSGELHRLAPSLDAVRIAVTFPSDETRKGKGRSRTLSLERIPEEPSAPSAPSEDEAQRHFAADGHADGVDPQPSADVEPSAQPSAEDQPPLRGFTTADEADGYARSLACVESRCAIPGCEAPMWSLTAAGSPRCIEHQRIADESHLLDEALLLGAQSVGGAV
jgi:hypothetical protein